MAEQSALEVALDFGDVDDFEGAIERNGAETGFFFQSAQSVQVGQRMTLKVTIRGISTAVFLDGIVAWRRLRSAGAGLPAGMFVVLSDRDRARIDGLLRYLRGGGARSERRKQPRFPILLEASYRTAKGSHRSETRNLSESGAFLRCSGPLLTVGAAFPVRLFLDGSGGKPVEIVAHVAWIDPFEDTKGMGIRFAEDQPALKRVAQLVKRFASDLQRFRSLAGN
ncbi:MAG TPA: PilZ domain-containing protein [Myxococcota bacterium]|nr:PilZ domain-containing protein [Myxococcota bacterium]HRY94465.1 PilZ domain-containing protein [Myxococcota bacterium]HSA21496.1 PilZ domain-containing protein [Myxococcota bacterium]